MSSHVSETLPSFDTASASNPIIQYSGQASFGANFYCMWVTKNGPVATLTVSNPGPNTLTFTVSGAPGTIVASDGKPLNGTHVIPPNQPTSKIIALGDFQGQNVFIFNVSNPSTTCQVNAITT